MLEVFLNKILHAAFSILSAIDDAFPLLLMNSNVKRRAKKPIKIFVREPLGIVPETIGTKMKIAR